MPHCEPGAVSRRAGNVPVVPEKPVDLARTELGERRQLHGRQRAGAQGALPTPADGNAAASLPRALDEDPMEEKVHLLQVGTPLRAMNWKRPADTPH